MLGSIVNTYPKTVLRCYMWTLTKREADNSEYNTWNLPACSVKLLCTIEDSALIINVAYFYFAKAYFVQVHDKPSRGMCVRKRGHELWHHREYSCIAVYELQATQYSSNKLSEVFFLSFLFLEFCPTFLYTFWRFKDLMWNLQN